MREKEHYRDMLSYLTTERQAPLLLSKSQAAKLLSVSRNRVCTLIADGYLQFDKKTNKIPIGTIARFLCG